MKAESRRQEAEGGWQKLAAIAILTFAFCLLPSAFSSAFCFLP
jgi:hypothetical protein